VASEPRDEPLLSRGYLSKVFSRFGRWATSTHHSHQATRLRGRRFPTEPAWSPLAFIGRALVLNEISDGRWRYRYRAVGPRTAKPSTRPADSSPPG
jgi:hypothetical protein